MLSWSSRWYALESLLPESARRQSAGPRTGPADAPYPGQRRDPRRRRLPRLDRRRRGADHDDLHPARLLRLRPYLLVQLRPQLAVPEAGLLLVDSRERLMARSSPQRPGREHRRPAD
jgi:hypothetical protein